MKLPIHRFLLSLVLSLFAPLAVGQTLFINEIMSSNSSTVADGTGDYADWVELYNPTAANVDISGYYVTDQLSNPTKYQLPVSASLVVPAGGYLLLWASNDPSRGARHLAFALSASGEEFGIFAPDGITQLDAVAFPALAANISYGRKPSGSANWVYFTSATPAATNNNAPSFSAFLDPPTFSHASGYYPGAFTLTLTSSDPDATIYYTTDGSEPNENNPSTTFTYRNRYVEVQGQTPGPILNATLQTHTYTAPIPIMDRTLNANRVSNYSSTYSYNPPYFPSEPVFKGTVVRAKVVKPGTLPSSVVTRTYLVTPEGNQRFRFPVISLAMPENYLFGYQEGIYNAGVTFDNWRAGNPSVSVNGPGFPGNFTRTGDQWEYPANMEVFDTLSTGAALSQVVDVRINGGHTRGLAQKSLRLYSSTFFTYPFFPSLPYTNHKRLILRNSGNDWGSTMFRDAVIQGMVSHLRFDRQAYCPSILLVNGEYWGIHNVRERFDKYYPSAKYGVDPDNLDMIENHYEVDEGDAVHYNAMINYLIANGPSNQANYENVKTRMDMDNFIDYQLAEIYAANTDWPENNIRCWRLRTPQYMPNAPYGHDGRWRWMMFDVDYGFGGFNGPTHNTLAFATNSDINAPAAPARTFLLRRLLENAEFRTNFINRFADMLNTTYLPSRVVGMINEYKQNLAPEMPEHIARWKAITNMTTWDNNVNVMINFAEQRPGNVRQHIRSKFSLAATHTLTVDVSHAQRGYVQVNTIAIVGTTPGVAEQPYPWQGTYFQGVPVTIRAKAKPGYRFTHWQSEATSFSDSVLVVHLTASATYQAFFEIDPDYLYNPAPYELSYACAYEFLAWESANPAGTFPESMAFVYMNQPDPTFGATLEGFTSGPYNYLSRSRVNGLGENGVAFINTTSSDPTAVNEGYPMGKVGGALLALNTLGLTKVEVSWTGGTLTPNVRPHAIRLQYRVGDSGEFSDVLGVDNQPVEYVRNATAGHSQTFTSIPLPAQALDQPYVQLFWRYYHTGTGTSGARDQLRLDDIRVGVGACESLASGNWNNVGLWSCGRVPTFCDEVVVSPGHIIELENSGMAKSLRIEADGALNMVASGLLQLGSQ
ncbi:hypothetical protein GCM10027275_42280 [Rhabdobacter roseus]|uniref:LTD domain-containing protein n=1 Tax=Rhabdobacter roseus TaxID=1655419 RepID=A0A840TX97_9BACT|nr:CotH kinase family protein [Rhabdobacter roseus]MBB5286207.1 hypothetical protein [Rhabdobacter roseus]